MHKKFYSNQGFKKKIKYFHFFLIVNMAANYAEIGRVGNLAGRFSTSFISSIFLKFSQYCETSII